MKNRHVMIVGSQNVGGSEASYYLAQESGVRAVEMAIYSTHHALQWLGSLQSFERLQSMKTTKVVQQGILSLEAGKFGTS
jgi:hypothetical protein